MGGKRVGVISTFSRFIAEELVFTNVILRLRIDLRLKEIVLMFSMRVRATEKISCIDFVFPLANVKSVARNV